MTAKLQPPANAGRVADVRVQPHACANPDNPRGRRSFEWRPWEGNEEVYFNNPQITFYWREPGEVCGAHCHRGNNVFDPDRNPEQILFIVGDVDVELEDLWGDSITYHVKAKPDRPFLMTIPPLVLHTFHVGTHGVHFMECKRNPYSRDPVKQDICTEEEFRTMQRAMP